MKTILDNRVLIAAFVAWAVAQISKTIYELIRYRKLRFNRLVSSGGMPSSHSALVSSLATATGRLSGIDSAAFAIAFVLAAIVMYDAAGVRRAVSLQARILNQMIEFIHVLYKIAKQLGVDPRHRALRPTGLKFLQLLDDCCIALAELQALRSDGVGIGLIITG